MVDLQELRRLAEAARDETNLPRHDCEQARYELSRACHPTAILQLLAELALARKVVEAAPHATADCDGVEDASGCPFCAALAAYRAAYPAKEGA